MRYLFLKLCVHYVVLEGSESSYLVRVVLLLWNAFGESFFQGRTSLAFIMKEQQRQQNSTQTFCAVFLAINQPDLHLM